MLLKTQDGNDPKNTTGSGETSLIKEPGSLPHNRDPAEERSGQSSTTKPKIAVNISNTDHYGRLIMLALTVAESIFPGFGDTWITRRLELGDLADYSLQVQVQRPDQEE